MDLSAEKYARVQEQLRGLEIGAIRQLDTATADGTPLLELCIEPREGPESQLARRELRALLGHALLELAERERQVLALYYKEELTMAEIGEVIGVSESRVSQLRSLALSRLRFCLRRSLGLPETQAAAPPDHSRAGHLYGIGVEQPPNRPLDWPSRAASATPVPRLRPRAAGRMVGRRQSGASHPAAVAVAVRPRAAIAPAMLDAAMA
jgi:hypothetical protein